MMPTMTFGDLRHISSRAAQSCNPHEPHNASFPEHALSLPRTRRASDRWRIILFCALSLSAFGCTSDDPNEAPEDAAVNDDAAVDGSVRYCGDAGCIVGGPDSIECDDLSPAEVSPERIAAFAQSNNAFAAALWAELPNGNVGFSPISLEVVLSMAYAGATEESRTVLGDVLAYDDAEAHLAAAALIRGWGEDTNLRFANTLFGARHHSWNPDYICPLEANFGARLQGTNFGNPAQAQAEINAWVSEQTDGTIPNLLGQPLRPDTNLAAINAMLFEAQWDVTFDPNASMMPFHNADGSVPHVPQLIARADLNYGAVGDVQFVEVPYAESDLAMLYVLPNEGHNVADVDFSVDALNQWVGALEEREVHLDLAGYSETLNPLALVEPLKALGGGALFESTDLSPMLTVGTPGNLDQVGQASAVSWNPEGTKIAVASYVGVAGSAPPGPDAEVILTIDRPFLYLLRDTQSGAVLFMGRVENIRWP